jgi:hypothetical protein
LVRPRPVGVYSHPGARWLRAPADLRCCGVGGTRYGLRY